VETNGNENTAIGVRALAAVNSGTGNVGIGVRAGHDVSSGNMRVTTGTNCTFIGTDAKMNSVTQLANATAIGAGAIVDGSNTIQLGNTNVIAVKTSGTITAATPTADTHLTTKLYVDNKFTTLSNQNLKTTDTVTFAGATINGNLTSTGNVSTSVAPTTGNHLTNKTYVDNKFTTLSNQNLKTTDVVTFAGLKLPTTGGTASTLNYYEEYEFNTGFNIAGASLSTIGIVRIGKLVNMCVKTGVNVTASGSAPFYSATALPPRFRPVAALNTFVEIYYNGARSTGVATINSTGIIDIFRTNGEYFAYGVNAGFIPFYMSWVV